MENKKVKSGHESANVNSSHKSSVFREGNHSEKKKLSETKKSTVFMSPQS